MTSGPVGGATTGRYVGRFRGHKGVVGIISIIQRNTGGLLGTTLTHTVPTSLHTLNTSQRPPFCKYISVSALCVPFCLVLFKFFILYFSLFSELVLVSVCEGSLSFSPHWISDYFIFSFSVFSPPPPFFFSLFNFLSASVSICGSGTCLSFT